MIQVDAYAEQGVLSPLRFLHHLNPLAKVGGPLPVMIFIIFTRDVVTPLGFVLFGLVILLIGAQLSLRARFGLVLGLPVMVALMSIALGLWTDPGRVDTSQVLVSLGDYRFYVGSWLLGLAAALRLASLAVLSMLSGLTTTGPDLVRAMVQQFRVPYRIGYTALAAFRFVPRFSDELQMIRAAHRVRGLSGGRGPLSRVQRGIGYIVPLLAGAMRHASRVAQAMDSRAFGISAQRTERHLVRWRASDTVFVAVFWMLSVGLILAVSPGALQWP